jgi:hypothetical protein
VARQLDGYHGAYLLRRELDDEIEFATVMIFDSSIMFGPSPARTMKRRMYRPRRGPCSHTLTRSPPTTRRCLPASRPADRCRGPLFSGLQRIEASDHYRPGSITHAAWGVDALRGVHAMYSVNKPGTARNGRQVC